MVSCSTFQSSEIYQSGKASWYGKSFQGKKTASGELFNSQAFTAAHPTLAFGTRVLVTSKSTGKSVKVRINDRGPFAHNRIIDLSYAAAAKLGMIQKGEDEVELRLR